MEIVENELSQKESRINIHYSIAMSIYSQKKIPFYPETIFSSSIVREMFNIDMKPASKREKERNSKFIPSRFMNKNVHGRLTCALI